MYLMVKLLSIVISIMTFAYVDFHKN